MVVAILSRLLFWFYTGRIWEDALISVTAARQVWEGGGLTHHAIEPRVHSFTSALGQLILIIGEGFGTGQGILVMRIASLAAAVAAIYYAYRICLKFRLGWAPQTFFLGFLALSHLHIFFGMAGMETQIAVALILAAVHYWLECRFVALGVACGLAVMCRPELALFGLTGAIGVLVWHRASFLRFAVCGVVTAAPWYIFATLYYGSPLPHTIRVKSIAMMRTPFASIEEIWSYIKHWSWRQIAPFYDYWAAYRAPIPDGIIMTTAAVFFALFLYGIWRTAKEDRRSVVISSFILGYVAYMILTTNGGYSMWYLPPMTAVMALFVAAGLSGLPSAAAIVLLGVYVLPLPFTLVLDRLVQQNIEIGVREHVGRALDHLMGPNDTAMLEPLGYIGWYAFNKTIYDYPGLSSKIAFEAMKKRRNLLHMIDELRPSYIVLRANELKTMHEFFPVMSKEYEPQEHFAVDASARNDFGGLSYYSSDYEFTILKKR
jgi:hypothetical protein